MPKLRALLVCCTALCASAIAPSRLAAQEVVQALPNPAAEDLSNAMRRLSADPESVSALVDAGEASLALDNVDAALGFFVRAQRIDPDDGKMLAGLGQVALRRGEAVTALQLFDNANAAGEPMEPLAGERALAYDLVGNNARAQRLYRQAIDDDPDPETMRRLALSYAISGDQAASEEVLLPLLQRQDLAAYRARAFALAILGKEDEAVTIAETMLPTRLSDRIAPYLRYMPRLTKAQQAAAANLGQFPTGAQIGRDDPQLAALAAAPEEDRPAPRTVARVDERLIPTGAPLASAAASPVSNEPPAAANVAQPVVQTVSAAPVEELPPLAGPEAPVTLAAATAERPVAATAAPAPSSAPQSFPADPVSLAGAEPFPVAADPAARAGAEPFPVAAEEPEVDLAAAFADFAGRARLPVIASVDAVDITRLEIPRERPAPPPPPPPPPPPAYPSRQWVQIATGRDLAAFRYDWRRIKREAGELLVNAKAFHVPWGEANRLLIGPFANVREANELVAKLTEAGIDSFRFTSEQGQEIKPL